MAPITYHNRLGGFDFLGLRKGRSGAMEIVYDDGVKRRIVWRVIGEANMAHIDAALSRAMSQIRVLPALYTELKKRSILIEAVHG
ncbi:hypothetical protein [Albirhodobacter sp. R86504]|jgi:hypothetical protein|uniref:hypothetical protein n=1 Tax=Albirhodobacter sp. R86504 TaxID=3093848 RepID=UPI00366FCF18